MSEFFGIIAVIILSVKTTFGKIMVWAACYLISFTLCLGLLCIIFSVLYYILRAVLIWLRFPIEKMEQYIEKFIEKSHFAGYSLLLVYFLLFIWFFCSDIRGAQNTLIGFGMNNPTIIDAMKFSAEVGWGPFFIMK
jgi:uncharacterized membrane protein